MINTKKIVKVAMLWISILYIACFAAVELFPPVRMGFMLYGLHMEFAAGQGILTFKTFIAGLVIWNALAIIGAWLFAALYNNLKD